MTCTVKPVADLKMEIKDSVQAAQLELQRQQQQQIANDMTLPGFRFHPTEEELVGYYLRRMVQGRRNSVELIASLDLYQYDPWELPAMAFMGEKEWFFFCPRDKKYPNGARPNRVTTSGYWKATGTDRTVRCTADFQCIGLKKTLVFYTGRAPRGKKTEWIMNEYRMPKLVDRSSNSLILGSSPGALCNTTVSDYNYVTSAKNDVALCRIYRKSNSGASSAGSNQLQLTQSATRESHLLGSRSTHQQLIANLEKSLQAIAPKHMITECKQQIASETRAGRILQEYHRPTVPAAALTFCSASSSHGQSVLPPTASNLRSSHALMARLLEESCCYTGRSSSQPIMALEYGDSGSHIDGLGSCISS